MALAHLYSARLGRLGEADARRVLEHLKSVGLPATLQDAHVKGTGQQLVDHMLHDKKMSGGKLPFILSNGIGKAYVDRTVDLKDVATFLDSQRG